MELNSGVLDLAGGTVIIRGEDMTEQVTSWFADRRMIALGGEGILSVDYDVTNPRATTIIACPRPDTMGLIY